MDSGIAESFGVIHACQLAGGLTLFLYGMERAVDGLRRSAGYRLKAILALITRNRFLAAIAGVIITVCLQSSSASTVLLVGLAETGAITLRQAMGVILGAGLGTTVTVQIIAFNVANYALLLLAAGFMLRVLPRAGNTRRALGGLLMGFGFIFYGMHVMKLGMGPLRHNTHFVEMLRTFGRNPLYGVLAATVFSAIVQSSAATLGVAVALASQPANPGAAVFQPLLPLTGAVALVIGANIGTCATALIASIMASRRGKQIAVAHLLFKVAGAAIVFPWLKGFAAAVGRLTEAMFRMTGGDPQGPAAAARAVANAHMLFALGLVVVFMPTMTWFGRLLARFLPYREEPFAGARMLDVKALGSPDEALHCAHNETLDVARVVRKMFAMARKGLRGDADVQPDAFLVSNTDIERRTLAVTRYLMELDPSRLEPAQAAARQNLLYIIRDVEYIGSVIGRELAITLAALDASGASLSFEGSRQLLDFWDSIAGHMESAFAGLRDGASAPAKEILAFEEGMEQHQQELHDAHLARLQKGVRATERTAMIHMDLLAALRRIHYFVAHIARLSGATGT